MQSSELKIATWNVNGLRSIVRWQTGGLQALLEQSCCLADIVCVHETKLRRSELTRDLAVAEGWESFWNCCQPGIGAKAGYSGVATFCKASAIPVSCEAGLTDSAPPDTAGAPGGTAASPLTQALSDELGFSLEELQVLDSEGRALITDHGLFLLVNLYGPALTIEERIEKRRAFKLNFYRVLEWRIRRWVAEGRAVVVVGDLNISPHPIDSCKPRPVAEFVRRPDRQWLVNLLGDADLGLTDAFRHLHPNREHAYTCWNTASGARVHNYGSRIDHILVAGPAPPQLAAALQQPHHPATAPASAATAPPSPTAGPHPAPGVPAAAAPLRLLDVVTQCDTASDQQGSDHAPVWASLRIPTELLPTGHAPPAGAGSRLFPGKQANLKAWLQQHPQPSSQPQQESQSQPWSQQQLTAQGAGSQAESAAAGTHRSSFSAQHAQELAASWADAAAGASQPAGTDPAGSAAGQAGAQGLPGAMQPGEATSSGSFGKRPSIADQAAAGPKRARAGGKALAGKGTPAGQLSLRSFFAAPAQPASAAAAAPQHQAGLAPQQHVSPGGQHPSQQQGTQPAAAATDGAGGRAEPASPSALQLGLPSKQQQQQPAQHMAPAAAASGDVQEALEAHGQATRAAWQRISNSMKAPCCAGHREPCVIRTVKKKGPNQGRQFWVCAQPEGPPPVGNCNHFQFANNPRKFKATSGGGSSGS